MTKELRISLKIVMEYPTLRGEFRAPLEHIKWLDCWNVVNSSALCHWLQWLVQFLKNYKILNRFSKKKSVNFVISEFSKTFENSMRIEILKNFKINILRPTMSWNQLHSALSKCSASEVHCLDAFSPRECSWRGIIKISFQIQSSKDY